MIGRQETAQQILLLIEKLKNHKLTTKEEPWLRRKLKDIGDKQNKRAPEEPERKLFGGKGW